MLDRRTVLIVEEEFLIAIDIQRVLEGMSAQQTIFTRSAHEALAIQERWPEIDLAIVELRQGDPASVQLAQKLSAAKIPMVICTADTSLRRGVAELPSAKVLIKPVPDEALASAIGQALAISI